MLIPTLIVLYAEEKMNMDMIPNNNTEKMSLICLTSDFMSFIRIVANNFRFELLEDSFSFTHFSPQKYDSILILFISVLGANLLILPLFNISIASLIC